MIPIQLDTDTINQLLDEMSNLLYDDLCQAHRERSTRKFQMNLVLFRKDQLIYEKNWSLHPCFNRRTGFKP
jgi:hypothetical protein